MEGQFLEAKEGSIRLPEDDPEVFYWLVQWMLQERLDVMKHYESYRIQNNSWRKHACRLLCRLSILAEKLLDERTFSPDRTDRSIHAGIQDGLDELFQGAALDREHTPVTPEIVIEVWENTVMDVEGPDLPRRPNPSLRVMLFSELCASVFHNPDVSDCSEYTECFTLDDGKFARDLMVPLMHQNHLNRYNMDGWPGSLGDANFKRHARFA